MKKSKILALAGSVCFAVSFATVAVFHAADTKDVPKDSGKVSELCGDINGSGIVNLADIIYLARCLSGNAAFQSWQSDNANCYKDGAVDVLDLLTMIKFVLGEIDSLPVVPEPAVTTTTQTAPTTTTTVATTTVSATTTTPAKTAGTTTTTPAKTAGTTTTTPAKTAGTTTTTPTTTAGTTTTTPTTMTTATTNTTTETTTTTTTTNAPNDEPPTPLRQVYVSDIDELYAAMADAKAGDEIIVGAGVYQPTKNGAKASLLRATADGTAEHPIVIRGELSPVASMPITKIAGMGTTANILMYITGDYWQVKDLSFENSGKGIVADNANYTLIENCVVTNIGEEGIHIRDGSSYCTIKDCTVTDTGVERPGYGEAIYIGSAYSTSGYSFDCHYNTITGCYLKSASECVDIKEYTIGTVVENCVLMGTNLSGENSANAIIKAKGNGAIIRNNVCYQDNNTQIRNIFETQGQVETWGYDNEFYGNTCYIDGADVYILRTYSGTSASAWNNTRIPAGNSYKEFSGSTLIIKE